MDITWRDRPWMHDPASDRQMARVRAIEDLFGIRYRGPRIKGAVGVFIGLHRDNFFQMEHEEIVNESFLHLLKN